MTGKNALAWPARLLLAAMLVWAVSFPGIASAQSVDDPREGKTCASCHSGANVWAGKHGNKGDARTPIAKAGCDTCHGDSTRHLQDPAQPLPREFRRMTAKDQDRVCAACHQGRERIQWRGSAHERADVACTTCHQQHADPDRLRGKQAQTALCLTCHTGQRVQIIRPSRHPILEGKVACSDCHNPHGSAGPALLTRRSINETCYACHMEKRGPFLRNHQPVQENCALCHEAHGTTIANLLRQRPPFLCQQCHEPTDHRGTVPGAVTGAGNSINRAVVLARGCVNCHTNIHGTNSPVDLPGDRTFRR